MLTLLEKKSLSKKCKFNELKLPTQKKMFLVYLQDPDKAINTLAKEQEISPWTLHQIIAKGLAENWAGHKNFLKR